MRTQTPLSPLEEKAKTSSTWSHGLLRSRGPRHPPIDLYPELYPELCPGLYPELCPGLYPELCLLNYVLNYILNYVLSYVLNSIGIYIPCFELYKDYIANFAMKLEESKEGTSFLKKGGSVTKLV